MSDSRTVLPAPKLLNLISARADANAITLSAKTSAGTAPCPVCGKRSGRVHSRYTRTLADLPWQGVPVSVRLRVRRFFCDQRACDRAIFAEPCPASLLVTLAGPSDSKAGLRTSLSPSVEKQVLVCWKTLALSSPETRC